MKGSQELESAVVLFDGVCTLCNRTVDFVIRHDRARRFRYGSLQSGSGRRLLEKFNLPVDRLDSFVVIHQGLVFTRSDAALKIAQQLGGPWRLLTVLRLVPRSVRDRVYDWVAGHRYAWFGKNDTCRIPSDAEKQLFLEP